jgi:GNAT superfamily N-acetyltransferase
LNNYREGCFGAFLDDKLIGYCASIRIGGDKALRPHSWDEITGNGYGSRHDPKGDWLYGYELCVDPKTRGTRIGRHLYEERRKLAEQHELKGNVFGGRMPNLSKSWRRVEGPED